MPQSKRKTIVSGQIYPKKNPWGSLDRFGIQQQFSIEALRSRGIFE